MNKPVSTWIKVLSQIIINHIIINTFYLSQKVNKITNEKKLSTRATKLLAGTVREGSDFSTWWRSLPYLRFHSEVSQGEEGPSGMASTVSRYEYYWAYLGKNEEEAWRSFGMPARWPSMPSPTTSSTLCQTRPTSSATLCQTRWKLFCRPKEPIQDINALTFSPWWNTRLIFNLLFYLFFVKLIIIGQDFCPGRNWLVHHYQAINLISIYYVFGFDSI